jgi:hypothetical protein
MKRIVTTCFVVAGLLAASSAMAVNVQKTPVPQNLRNVHQMSANVVLGCDDGVEFNAYYQGTDQRFGNLFSFGAGSSLSAVSFMHYGYGYPGPYAYNLEVWDPTSCTKVAFKNGLFAQDAAAASAVENVDLCSAGINLSGNLIVAIDPNKCAAVNDCYPDLEFDDQINVACPYIITPTGVTPCFDNSANAGPFLLRVSINGCQTPTQSQSWGQLKSIYR